jgi:hypothetical protein
VTPWVAGIPDHGETIRLSSGKNSGQMLLVSVPRRADGVERHGRSGWIRYGTVIQGALLASHVCYTVRSRGLCLSKERQPGLRAGLHRLGIVLKFNLFPNRGHGKPQKSLQILKIFLDPPALIVGLIVPKPRSESGSLFEPPFREVFIKNFFEEDFLIVAESAGRRATQKSLTRTSRLFLYPTPAISRSPWSSAALD